VTVDTQLPDRPSRDEVITALATRGYLADRGVATVVAVAIAMGKPLLLEGEAGVGKTELAKTVAAAMGSRIVRLQCYEGIDVSHALYDWDYTRQMLQIRALEAAGAIDPAGVGELFGRDFLIRRPLLDAIDHDDPRPRVLLIDEIDRADDEFEAFLLELLSDFQVTIPEIGTISARRTPIVFLTSNRTRELHDALKRRCLYHWIEHPTLEREVEILKVRVPDVPPQLARDVAAFVERLRRLPLAKSPGVAETLDWVQALDVLGEQQLTLDVVRSTLGAVIKHSDDLERVQQAGLERLIAAPGD
jgi:MoxR-like ATPase